jgi:hypothetical protein
VNLSAAKEYTIYDFETRPANKLRSSEIPIERVMTRTRSKDPSEYGFKI